MAPKDAYALIPGTHECVILQGKREFAEVIINSASWDGKVILDSPGWPALITRVHIRGKSGEREEAKLLALKMEKGPQAKKCRQFLEARKGKT